MLVVGNDAVGARQRRGDAGGDRVASRPGSRSSSPRCTRRATDGPARGEALVAAPRQPARQVRCRRSTTSTGPRDRPPSVLALSGLRLAPARGRPLRLSTKQRPPARYPTSRSEAGRPVAGRAAALAVAPCSPSLAPAHGATGAATPPHRSGSRARHRAPERRVVRLCKASTCPTSTACSRHRRSAVMVTNGVDRPSPIGERLRDVRRGRPGDRQRRDRRARASASTKTSGATAPVYVLHHPHRHPARRRPGVHADHRRHRGRTTSELYGAEVGLLGDELARAGIARSVIANGDGTDPSTPEDACSPWRRAAVAALDDQRRQGAGRAGRHAICCRHDAAAPFGVRLDPDRVLDAFARRRGPPGSVVLVEGSDLVRADLAGRFASDEQAVKHLRADALERHRRLVGRLLDARRRPTTRCIVVGPAPPTERAALSVGRASAHRASSRDCCARRRRNATAS